MFVAFCEVSWSLEPGPKDPDLYKVTWRQLVTFAEWYRWRWGEASGDSEISPDLGVEWFLHGFGMFFFFLFYVFFGFCRVLSELRLQVDFVASDSGTRSTSGSTPAVCRRSGASCPKGPQ